MEEGTVVERQERLREVISVSRSPGKQSWDRWKTPKETLQQLVGLFLCLDGIWVKLRLLFACRE